MNSLIQSLASSKKIIDNFENLQNESILDNEKLKNFVDLLKSVNNYKSKIEENTDKLSSLINNINWERPPQDLYDLLSALINDMQTGIEGNMPVKITIIYKFQGVEIPNRLQNHLGLSLGLCGNYGVCPGVRLEDLIYNYFSPTFIDEDPNKIVQSSVYEESPEILLLHIQANRWDQNLGMMITPRYHIQYKENIELELPVAQDLNEKIEYELVKYRLCAVINHIDNISGDHYVCYRKGNRNWFQIDDEQVTVFDFKCNKCPYILIYEK